MHGQLEIPVWVSEFCGNEKNCRYKDARVVSSAEELKAAVSKDHTFIEFKNHYRNEGNFISTKCLVVDCDNGHSEENWIWVEQIKEAFPDVTFVVYTSRNHMKQKGKVSARPRYHVIFPIDEITKPADYKNLLKRVQDYFPYFDSKAQDAARFFFGNENAEITIVEGSMTLSGFFNGEDAFANMGEEIEEGNRNATMFHNAVCLLKRYGNTEEAKERFINAADKCNPPLETEELKTIWKSGLKYYQKILKQPGYVKPEVYNNPEPIQWEEPIPFDKVIRNPFPIEAFPDEIADYVKSVSLSTQTPIDMAGVLALAIISASIQGKYKIQGKRDWTEPLNTYVLTIAPPSERKSAILNAMAKPLYEYENEYNRRNNAAVEASKMHKRMLDKKQRMIEDQLVKGKVEEDELEKIAEEIVNFKEVRPLKLYVDDITTEKLVSVLAENNGRAALISSEGGIFDTLSGIYTKNVNIDVMLKGYSGDPIRVDRIGRDSETILDPVLTILLMAQPNVVSDVLSNTTFRGRGLTARFLYCMPTSEVGKRAFNSGAETTEDVYGKYERRIKNLLEDEYLSKPEMITLSDEARNLLANFSDEIEPKLITEYQEIAAWAGKLVGNTLRIAGLLCRASIMRGHDFLDSNDALVVDADTMSNAIKLGRYFLNHAQAAFAILPEDMMYRKAEKIIKMIQENGFVEFDRRMAMRKCRSFKTVDDIQPVLNFLEDYGYIAQKPLEQMKYVGRQPLPKYEVNPYIRQ